MLPYNFLSYIPKPQSSPYKSASWKRVEQLLETTLPHDYKTFVELYGNGLICGAIRIHNPFSGYGDWFEAVLGMYRKMREVFPYSLYPELNGLLPFGGTKNGGLHLMWQTTGANPDNWSVVLVNCDDFTVDALNCNMTDFLLKVATREIAGERLNCGDGLDYENMFQPLF